MKAQELEILRIKEGGNLGPPIPPRYRPSEETIASMEIISQAAQERGLSKPPKPEEAVPSKPEEAVPLERLGEGDNEEAMEAAPLPMQEEEVGAFSDTQIRRDPRPFLIVPPRS